MNRSRNMESSTKPNRLLRIGLTIGVLAVGVVGSMLTIKFKTKAESKPSERKLPSVRVVTAKPGSHTYQIQSQGTALPRTSIQLVSEVSGRVVSVSDKFDAGQVFKKDDVLLTIDSRDYELALAQAEAAGAFQTVDHPKAGRFRTVAPPIVLSGHELRSGRCGPELGADSRDVLAEAGLSDEEIDAALES